ncbi:MAG: DegV family protein [Anaerolineae bacterium]|nr:DegV family protein [Anaerolineae bacterium]
MVRIITDTTSGLPQDIAQKYDIPVIPQVINFGQESYYECIEMDSKMFMDKLLASTELPRTAAPPPELFRPHFERFVATGEPILCIHPSAKLSGTVRSATVAQGEFPQADIRVMDTETIGGALAWMVIRAAEWAAEGLDADTIWDRLEDMKARMRIYFTVDTLEYLQRGGRIGGAKALLGNLLQIRPILTIQGGQIEPLTNERTRKRALKHIMDLAEELAPRDRDPLFSVMHAAAPDVAQELALEIGGVFGDVRVLVMDLVPAIVTHGGPGAMGLSFFA